jgi:endonuclease/exonuclease/phosphatase family metal-dependent hydrolase
MGRYIPLRALIAVAATGAVLTAAPAHAESTEIKVISHNIRGGQINNGALYTLDLVKSQIASFAPDVVMLQEVCQSQATNFANTYQPLGWTVHYVVRREHPDCDGVPDGATAPIGELIAIPRAGSPYREFLPGDGSSNTYSISCLTFFKNTGREYLACNTHLSAGSTLGAIRDSQLAQIQNSMQWSINYGRGVILGGDLNMTPDITSMDKLYKIRNDGSLTGNGSFFEADQTDATYFRSVCSGQPFCRSGQPTKGSEKYDYLFFAANKTTVNSLSGGVVASPYSNHDLYRGRGLFVW